MFRSSMSPAPAAASAPRRRGRARAPAVLVALSVALAVACTIRPDGPPLEPLSPECEGCLDRVDGGCRQEDDACSADEACERALLCLLASGCLEERSVAACAEAHGCEQPAAGSEGADRLDAYERCARERCAAPCDFAEP